MALLVNRIRKGPFSSEFWQRFLGLILNHKCKVRRLHSYFLRFIDDKCAGVIKTKPMEALSLQLHLPGRCKVTICSDDQKPILVQTEYI